MALNSSSWAEGIWFTACCWQQSMRVLMFARSQAIIIATLLECQISAIIIASLLECQISAIILACLLQCHSHSVTITGWVGAIAWLYFKLAFCTAIATVAVSMVSKNEHFHCWCPIYHYYFSKSCV